jgi:hypothetical protein
MSIDFVRFSTPAPASESARPSQRPAAPAASSAPSDTPDKVLVEMLMAGRIQQAIYAAAVLGVADVLADGPMEVEEIARRTGAHAGALRRLLRALAGHGIFAEDDRARFVLTPMASLLRMGTPMSLRPVAIWCGTVAHRVFGDIEHTIRTGTPAFDHTFGMEFFDYLDEHRDIGVLFDAFMARQTATIAAVLPTAYAFDRVGTLVDVGGGRGQLLAAVLKAFPSMRGLLFDRPCLIDGAREYLEHSGVLDRCTTVAGDIAADVPSGGDAYLLKSIVHGVDDETAVGWLRNCRRAMLDGARLLLVEMVLPAGNAPHPSKMMDLLMLVGTHGGRERTEAEFGSLLARAGFTLSRIVRTPSPYSVVEALPA